jgi:hypothetical protein
MNPIVQKKVSMISTATRIARVSATKFRDRFKTYAKKAKGGHVVLVENRRQESKYLVDTKWLDSLLRERESILATLEVLADRKLTGRLLRISRKLDKDIKAGRLHTMEEVFGE